MEIRRLPAIVVILGSALAAWSDFNVTLNVKAD